MNSKFLFLAISLFLFYKAECQKAQVKSGIYESGINSIIDGYWLLKHDSTFVFVQFEGNYARYIGTGKWALEKETMLRFSFNDEILPILQKVTFQYTADTRLPFDSIFINGRIKDQENQNISTASIIINGKYHTISDTSGFFKIKLPRIFAPQNLIVVQKLFGYEIVEFKLNPNVNFHHLNIVVPKSDSLSCEPAYNSNVLKQPLLFNKEVLFTYYNTPVVKKKYNSISFMSDDRNILLDKLFKARELQPLSQLSLQQLIDFIKK